MNNSHWNYRVINRNGQLAIHSAYYSGSAEPSGWSAQPAIVTGESIEELQDELLRFNEALAKPVISNDELPPSATDEFATQARELVALLTLGAPLQEHSLVTRLSMLYALAFALPRREPSTDLKHEDVALTFPASFGLAAQLYATTDVFDPLAGPTYGDLDDDLRDIANDLAKGLAFFDAGDVEGAAWFWTFSFDSHWGTHAAEALRVLHRLAAR